MSECVSESAEGSSVRISFRGMRDDFPEKVKQTLANRAAHHCSNPDCRAQTVGPQLAANAAAVSVGRAAHITAAAPGGPRYDPSLTPRQRSAQSNGIWLCAICADKVDRDAAAYPVELLREWKNTAEAEARGQLGRARSRPSDPFLARERQIKREHKLRDQLRKALLRPFDISKAHLHEARPYEKFLHHKLIIHSLDDKTYPDVDTNAPPGRISSWFRVEPYDFYPGGLMVTLWGTTGVVDQDGRWALIRYNEPVPEPSFRRVGIWQVGKIPWRNIRHFDVHGDGYYNAPHLYCAFADAGEPYEGFAHFVQGQDLDWQLDPHREIKRDATGRLELTPSLTDKSQG